MASRLDLAILSELIQEIGVFGQAFFPSNRKLASKSVFGAACLLWLSACGGDPGEQLQSGRVFSWAGPEGRWVGPVAPVEPDCGLRTTGLMSIDRSTFAFDPFQSTAVMSGKIGPAGDLTGEAVRPAPGNRSVTIDFVGRVEQSEGAERVVGSLTSGRCHWSVMLLRG